MRGMVLGLVAVLTLLVAIALLRAPPGGGIDWQSSMQRVEVTALGDPEDVVAYLEALGGVIEVRSQQRIQALVPQHRLPELRAASSMLRIEPPAVMVPLQIPFLLPVAVEP